MSTVVTGMVWVFGDDVDTDQLAPFAALSQPWPAGRPLMMPGRPDWSTSVEPGDVIVAGRNWGCGSSREQAVTNLQHLGIAAIVASSFARIFFRTSIAVGLPVLACPGAAQAFRDGDVCTLDLADARVANRTSGWLGHGQPYAPLMLDIVRRGGLLRLLDRSIDTPVAPPTMR